MNLNDSSKRWTLEPINPWKGPQLISMYYNFARPGVQERLERQRDLLLQNCRQLGARLTIWRLDEEDFPPEITEATYPFVKYKKRWNRVWPFFIQEALDYFNEPVMAIFIDAQILHLPPLWAFNGDVRLSCGSSNPLPDGSRRQHILGTPVYVRNSPKARMFLNSWTMKCSRGDLPGGEHRFLKETALQFGGYAPQVGLFGCDMSTRVDDGSAILF